MMRLPYRGRTPAGCEFLASSWSRLLRRTSRCPSSARQNVGGVVGRHSASIWAASSDRFSGRRRQLLIKLRKSLGRSSAGKWRNRQTCSLRLRFSRCSAMSAGWEYSDSPSSRYYALRRARWRYCRQVRRLCPRPSRVFPLFLSRLALCRRVSFSSGPYPTWTYPPPLNRITSQGYQKLR